MDGLEPVIPEKLINFHYKRNQDEYTVNANKLIKTIDEAKESGDFNKMTELLPALKKNVGNHLNYVFFWDSFAPISQGGGAEPSSNSDIGKAISHTFGSFNAFKLIYSETIE